MIAAIIVIILAVLVIGYMVALYNWLVRLRNMAQEGWSGIDVQLKRRCDLVPNLVASVKGYATHESATLEAVTRARQQVISAGDDTEARLKAENMLTNTLRSLFAVSEAYPDLKANQNFMQLQEELTKLEDEIQMSRRYYNGAARNLNTAVQSFPAVLFAKSFGFSAMAYFEADEAERATPKVAF